MLERKKISIDPFNSQHLRQEIYLNIKLNKRTKKKQTKLLLFHL